jgi:5-methylcytosine-specific restriction protein A
MSKPVLHLKAGTERIRGRTLQRLRRQAMQANPLCRKCEEKGRVSVATERDHIVPLYKGGKDVPENIQLLCSDCHRDKTAEDMGYIVKPVIGTDGWPVR